MKLIVRPIEKKDNKEQIFELCKTNNLIESKYATNYNVWDFQYNSNPLKKSWNSVLVNKENNTILGHMGLIPLIIRAFSSDWLSASISNGVVSNEVRNKLLPFKKIKTFAITPLINCCVQEAFNDNVDVSFVYSTIHPLIWRTLKFNEIKVEQKTTIHSSIGQLFSIYYFSFIKKYKASSFRFLAFLYSSALIMVNLIKSSIVKFRSFSKTIKKSKLKVDKVSEFNLEFDIFMNEFYKTNSELITYKRNIGFLNWRFESDTFGKYIFRLNNKIIGYIILEKNRTANNYSVIDCVILDKYLSHSSSMLKTLNSLEKAPITFTHYLSCNYSNQLFKESLKQGHVLNNNPFRLFIFKNKKLTTPSFMYYKINDSSIKNVNLINLFKTNNWFITPIFFNPSYHSKNI